MELETLLELRGKEEEVLLEVEEARDFLKEVVEAEEGGEQLRWHWINQLMSPEFLAVSLSTVSIVLLVMPSQLNKNDENKLHYPL